MGEAVNLILVALLTNKLKKKEKNYKIKIKLFRFGGINLIN